MRPLVVGVVSVLRGERRFVTASALGETYLYRALLGTRDELISSGSEAGRRRIIGVVAALPIYPRTTTPMVRR